MALLCNDHPRCRRCVDIEQVPVEDETRILTGVQKTKKNGRRLKAET